jgi:hypothetical protein
VAMRGEAVGAMGDLMRGVQQVCTLIARDISIKDVTATAAKVEMSMDKVGQLEDSMGRFMGDLEIPSEDDGVSSPEISAEERAQLAPMLESLRQEVGAEGRTSLRSQASEPAAPGAVDQALGRLRELRTQRG